MSSELVDMSIQTLPIFNSTTPAGVFLTFGIILAPGIRDSTKPNLQFPYYRFNVEQGMECMGLEEWKAKIRMGELAAQYMR